MKDVLLKVEGLHKRFGLTHANNDITMSVHKGEIRGLAGENGSGKSTLTSIISGLQPKDEGDMYLHGKSYNPGTPIQANEMKVAMVVQELGVITNFTGAMNIYLGKMDQFKKFGLIDTKKILAEAQAIFDYWDIGSVPLDQPTANLTMEQRKMIELARALSTNPDLLILDEITQSLSHDTRQIIHRLKDRFKKENKSMIIISHDLDETMDICDSITVLRDGKVVNTVATENMTLDDLKQMMIGREIEGDYYRVDQVSSREDEVLLDIINLGTKDRHLHDINFKLHKGEIVGVCGLSDAGIHTLGTCIYGLQEDRVGQVVDVKRNINMNHPLDVINGKGAYLSKNRDEEGLMLQASIYDNFYTPSATSLAGPFWFTKPADIKKYVQRGYDDFDVKAKGIHQTISNLSGGNKQKINLGRWLVKDLNFVVLDCPTRGVDIGVKSYIYKELLALKSQGVGILLISDELQEVIGMSDRILVLKDGELVSEMHREEVFSESKIVEVMI